MSEADDTTDEDAVASRDDVWVEKYRPQRLADVVGHETIVERIQQYVAEDDLPNLLFAGPAGVGKCVTGETPVLTNQGVERIEDVVGDADGFEEPDETLEVLTFDRGEFEYTRPSQVFGKEAEETVTVDTRDGGATTTTPEHRYLVVDDGGFEWRTAENLCPGDRVARPLQAPSPPDDPELNWIDELDGDRIAVHLTEEFAERHEIPIEEEFVGEKKRAIRGFRLGQTDQEIADQSPSPTDTVRHYRRQTTDVDLDRTGTHCSLSYLRDLNIEDDDLREHVTSLQFVTRSNKRSLPITPVWECTPELAEFVGLSISEARIEDSRIKFYNTDERLLDRFEALAESLFDVETKRGVQKDVEYVTVQSRTLLHFLDGCFEVFDLDGESGIGSTLLQAAEDCQAAFLRAMFDAEGYVTDQGAIQLTQKEESYVTLLSYLLSALGIPSRRYTEYKSATNGTGTEREYHEIAISGARHLKRFQDRVGFGIDYKADRLDQWASDETNPNHDTIPAQNAVRELCEDLYLSQTELLTETLNPETPGREAYLEDVDRVVQAAAKRLETAQEVRAEVEALQSELQSVSKLPATWAARHADIEPKPVRETIESSVGARSDYLLEYARGERTPRANRATAILGELGAIDGHPPVATVQETLEDAIDRLGVPYNHVAAGTEYRGTDVINLLERDDHALPSLARFETVADRVVEVASEMLTEEVLASVRTLDVLSRNELYFDEVEAVSHETGERRVYDLTVPETHNYVAGDVPTVMHNTTTAIAIAKEIYGDAWEEQFLELNASDQRGIDVIRDEVKDFASTDWKGRSADQPSIIFLDEADALTSDAQSALRRTMEQFSGNTRFILSCNYSSQIIDPIQSRCAVFRFPPLSDEAIVEQVRIVAEAEGIEVQQDGLDAIAYAADGDMRRGINALQAAATTGEVVDEASVYEITSTARPEEVLEMVEHAMDGDFLAARADLESLLIDRGIAGGDVIDQLHRSVWDLDIEEAAAVRLMDRVGEAEYRIVEGADERIQLEAMLASLALED